MDNEFDFPTLQEEGLKIEYDKENNRIVFSDDEGREHFFKTTNALRALSLYRTAVYQRQLGKLDLDKSIVKTA